MPRCHAFPIHLSIHRALRAPTHPPTRSLSLSRAAFGERQLQKESASAAEKQIEVP